MIKFVILCLLVIIALALLAGPGVRRSLRQQISEPGDTAAGTGATR